MAKQGVRQQRLMTSGGGYSLTRCALVLLLVVGGIVWMAVYINVAMDAANFVKVAGAKKPDSPLPWMSDLQRWNFVIGFGLIMIGLMVSAHKGTPLGRGQGVVVGMLGSFLLGLVWIVTFYFVGQDTSIPVMNQLKQSNLFVGIAFMAVGFSFATKWE